VIAIVSQIHGSRHRQARVLQLSWRPADMAFALSQVLVTRIRSRRVIVALVLGVFFLLHHREAPTLPVPITGYGPLTHLSSGGLTPSGSLPLVTLIVVFNGKDFHRFTPYFLESVRRQKALELVIVQRGDECSDLKNWTKMARNIRVSVPSPVHLPSEVPPHSCPLACLPVRERL
jgi:hypothetical protein